MRDQMSNKAIDAGRRRFLSAGLRAGRSVTGPDPGIVLSYDACLAHKGIHCECCRDSCGDGALRFRPRLHAPPAPNVDADKCTKCGACADVCPVAAIALNGQAGISGATEAIHE